MQEAARTRESPTSNSLARKSFAESGDSLLQYKVRMKLRNSQQVAKFRLTRSFAARSVYNPFKTSRSIAMKRTWCRTASDPSRRVRAKVEALYNDGSGSELAKKEAPPESRLLAKLRKT